MRPVLVMRFSKSVLQRKTGHTEADLKSDHDRACISPFCIRYWFISYDSKSNQTSNGSIGFLPCQIQVGASALRFACLRTLRFDRAGQNGWIPRTVCTGRRRGTIVRPSIAPNCRVLPPPMLVTVLDPIRPREFSQKPQFCWGLAFTTQPTLIHNSETLLSLECHRNRAVCVSLSNGLSMQFLLQAKERKGIRDCFGDSGLKIKCR